MQYGEWCSQLSTALRQMGRRSSLAGFDSSYLISLYNQGLPPADAAVQLYVSRPTQPESAETARDAPDFRILSFLRKFFLVFGCFICGVHALGFLVAFLVLLAAIASQDGGAVAGGLVTLIGPSIYCLFGFAFGALFILVAQVIPILTGIYMRHGQP